MQPFIPSFDLLEKIPIGILILDKKYQVLEWNHILETWTHIPKSKIIGRNLKEVFPYVNQKKFTLRIDSVFAGGPPVILSPQLHHHFIPVDAKEHLHAVQHTTITSFSDVTHGTCVMISIQDVSELSRRVSAFKDMRNQALTEIKNRRIAEHKLSALNQEYQSFSSRVAHDVRNPLALCYNLAEICLMELEEDHPAREFLDQIVSTSQFGINLLDGLYKLSGLCNQDITFSRHPVKDIFNTVGEILSIDIEESQAKVEFIGEDDFDCSKNLFPQVFQNFIANSLKYVKRKDIYVRIKTEITDTNQLSIHIEDNGPGIPEEKRKQIFDAFTRLESKNSEVKGLGIGLNIVKKILDLHKATIETSSSEDLGGVHFTIKMPQYQLF